MLESSVISGAVAFAPGLHAWPSPPAWVTRLALECDETSFSFTGPVRAGAGTLTVRRGGGIALVSARLPRADALDVTELRAATAEVYRAIREALAGAGAPNPVRIWNFIPAIHEPVAEGIDRYQAFNMGRFDGLSAWFGGPERFPDLLPTASGVGHSGHALLVFALGAPEPGRPVENARQRPAFRYTRRYGPRPPCFARATRAVLPDGPRLLVGGTASIRGEDSIHEGSLQCQLDEVFENLRSLIGRGEAGLGLIRDARVYYRRSADASRIRASVARLLPSGASLDLVQAEICRRELLVELEALADDPGD